ncbi:MAG: ATP-dependent helicase, partial [Paracoccaceae bacterium]|nr:ATP-dependent helicase [Paracoccaceae bacterium]
CSAEEVDLLKQIEKLMKIEIPVGSGTRPQELHGAKKSNGPKRGGRGNNNGQRRGFGGGGKPDGAGKPAGGNRRRRPRKAA